MEFLHTCGNLSSEKQKDILITQMKHLALWENKSRMVLKKKNGYPHAEEWN